MQALNDIASEYSRGWRVNTREHGLPRQSEMQGTEGSCAEECFPQGLASTTLELDNITCPTPVPSHIIYGARRTSGGVYHSNAV